MGTTKRQDFDQETNAIAEICKALGHPTRMQIMTLLWNKNNRTCGEIVSLIPLAQSTISKHLLELKKADLLNVKHVGKKTIYSIEVEKIQILKKYLTHYLSNKLLSKEAEIPVLPPTPKIKKRDKLYLKELNYKFPDKKRKTDQGNIE
ncbi:metalloregulator ArsR/SmtB family transcription factor [Flavobacterium granuli]|uniref:DNA-binding transcriptional ArsR family regulator n=1 Tax=Flavobacterium granuli TaxID=280093 RepID=A0ABU1S2P8_9FLAO|nr:metalloregulator ArsR/SmtB family transcription factor [Flavobacterium granuli]MDR6845290.1 DNA-binding transcriptional ArsR family regulator [Flavobacterium granuli]